MDTDGVSLMLPAGYDVLWTATVLALVLLTGAALVIWSLRRRRGAAELLELVLVVVVPVLGPLAYLVGELALSRRRARARRDAATS